MIDYNVTKYLNEKYNPSLILLYGSFSDGTMNKESDIDLILYAPVNKFIHDSNIINGYLLDAWIYPENDINLIEKVIHIIPCKIIKDDKETGTDLIQKIEILRNTKNRKMDSDEKKQINEWIQKMIKRAKGKGIESNYRYYWLLHDFPELYCKFTNQYYNGPIKTIKKINQENIKISKIYLKLLNGRKNIKNMGNLYKMLQEFC